MDRKTLSFLFLLAILGAALRFSYLTYNPPSLNWDEVSHGYNAYSILRTGMDQWGQKFPLFNFRAYGDYPTTLNLYLTIPFILLFGLTEFAIRFPHALLGTFTIISAYFVTWGLTRRRDLSLLTAFLIAIGPWYLFASRFVLQSNLSVFLLTTSAAFFLNRERSRYFLPASLLFLFLTLFSYHTTRIFSPLILFGSVLIYWQELLTLLKKRNSSGMSLLLFFVLFFGLSLVILRNPESTARSGVLAIVDGGAISKIENLRVTSKLPEIAKRLVYNRPVYFVQVFFKNYIGYFSPEFLFLKGGTQFQFSVPDRGLIYPASLPFFYIGFILLVVKSLKNKNYRLIFLWLLLSPVPASITNEKFAVVRATTMLPIPEVLIALGFFWLVSKLPKALGSFTTILYSIVVILSLESYLMNYFSLYRTNYSWSWQYGYKEVVDYVGEHYSDYGKIIVTKKYGEPHEYFLFFLKYDPAKYQSDPDKIAFPQSNWWWVDHFDKFWFVNDWQVKDLVTESKIKIDCIAVKCLLISSPDNFPEGWKKLKVINFLDGKTAFEIFSN